MRYALTNYILSITIPDTLQRIFGAKSISIGGQGSYLDSVSVELDNDLYSTDSDATGGYVHNKNLSKTGKCNVTINQLADKVAKFKRLCNMYYNGDYNGCTLTITGTNGDLVCTCADCLITKIPTQDFGQTATNQTWSFTCGVIVFN